MKNIAITGISGYVGTRLLAYLDRTNEVQKIIGIDAREPRYKSAKLTFYQRDIREPLGDLFGVNGVDTAVHLAFILRPTRQAALVRQIDVQGTMNLLDACRRAGVQHLLYLSSHTVYGARRDNPVPLTEEAPLRPLSDFQYSQDKVETEGILRGLAASGREITVTVLRSCPVIGPNARGSATTIMFQPPVMIGVAGYDPPLQFTHEDDLIDIMGVCLAQRKGGIYNVAGEGTLKYSEVAQMAGKRLLKLPEPLLKTAISLSWRMHLQSASPASGLEFIKYPPVVSTEKLKTELGFRFRYSSREALASFVKTIIK
jgi:UDP-glucose 4-epimerase